MLEIIELLKDVEIIDKIIKEHQEEIKRLMDNNDVELIRRHKHLIKTALKRKEELKGND